MPIENSVNNNFQKQAGFTLIEMLIVIVVLGIIAMIIVPQISVSSKEATLRTVQTNLNTLRRAVEFYYAQHDNTYPGFNDDGGDTAEDAADAEKGFKMQLTRYTDVTGEDDTHKNSSYKFGPYIKGGELPTNPYNGKNNVKCDITTVDNTVKASGGNTGWKFYVRTGVLIANDGAHDDL